MKTLIIILLIALSSCNRYCDPVNIMNGKSEQHHEQKKFRVIKLKAIGNNHYYVQAIRYWEKRKMIFDCRPEIINDSILLD